MGARLADETVAGFTGRDEGIRASLERFWTEEPDAGGGWGMGPDVRAWMARAIAAAEEAEDDPEAR